MLSSASQSLSSDRVANPANFQVVYGDQHPLHNANDYNNDGSSSLALSQSLNPTLIGGNDRNIVDEEDIVRNLITASSHDPSLRKSHERPLIKRQTQYAAALIKEHAPLISRDVGSLGSYH